MGDAHKWDWTIVINSGCQREYENTWAIEEGCNHLDMTENPKK